MSFQTTLPGPAADRATQWAAHLAARENRTPKNYAICRQDLGHDHYARVLIELRRAKAITKAVLRAEVNKLWPTAQVTEITSLADWNELVKATKPAKAGERA